MSAEAGAGPRKLRLFFAFWPDATMRRVLAAATAPVVAGVDGKVVPPRNFHVTLAFLGGVPGRKLARLLEIGGQEPYPAVDLALERLEYWAEPKLLVAASIGVPSSGLDIVHRLWGRLEPLGFVRESRPWRPHVTLVRRLRSPPPPQLPVSLPGLPSVGTAPWRVALVESTSHPEGSRYKPLADWPLGSQRGRSPLIA